MRKILLYGLNEENKKKFKPMEEFFEIKFLDYKHLNNQISELFDYPLNELLLKEDCNNLDDLFKNEFMLLDGFNHNEDLGALFSFLRELNIKRPITSVRTKINEKWILKDLLSEIYKENQYMIKMMEKNKETTL